MEKNNDMIKRIVDEIKSDLLLVPFIDAVHGLTRVHREVVKSGANTVVKSYPVAEQTPTDCSAGKEIDCVPDSAKKSLCYFELNGAPKVTQSSKPSWFEFSAQVRNVWWINTDLVKTTATIDDLMLQVLKYLPAKISGLTGISQVVVELTGTPMQSDIFSKYTYDETSRQYLMPPYRYFAFDLLITWQVNKDCFTDIIVAPVACT